MPDYIIINGDLAIFDVTFGAATVVVRPGSMQATGLSTKSGIKICVKGDEAQVAVPGCMYITPQYVIPGTGTLKIASLAGDQATQTTRSGKKAIIIKGSSFIARFEVQTPAQQPNPPGPPLPDGSPQYSGTGKFQTTNVKWRAS